MAADHLDMELMAEAELMRLQRQYRIMEGDRKAFFDEITQTLKQQRKIIMRMKTEKQDLLTDIRVASCDGQRRKDLKTSSELEQLLDKHAEVVCTLQATKSTLEEVNHQIKKTEKHVSRLKLKEITDGDYEERIKSGRRTIDALQNKLNTTTKRFCGTLTENKIMREEIDHLLKERTNFNIIWEKLVCDLNMGKKFLLELIEQATLAFDQREEWCSKLHALKIRTHNDVILHTQEMRKMHRELDQFAKLREFLSVKGQKRVMRDLELKDERKKEEERDQIRRQIAMYEEILAKITVFCEDERDVERIAAKYLKQEEENFALFNYVNELNNELEHLDDAIKEEETRIEDQKELCQQKARQEAASLEVLVGELNACCKQRELDARSLAETLAEFTQVLDLIQDVFVLLSCDLSPVLHLLHKRSQINEDNVMIYLGLIEKKTTYIITTLYFKEKALLKSRKN